MRLAVLSLTILGLSALCAQPAHSDSYGLLIVRNHSSFPAKIYATDNGVTTFLGRLGPGDEFGKAEPLGDTISLEADLITPDPVIVVLGPTYVQDDLNKWVVNDPG